MLSILLFLLIIVLFYFHLSVQFKKPREPLEIYETIYESKKQIEILNSQKQTYIFEIKELCPITFTTSLEELECIISLIDLTKYYKNFYDSMLEISFNKCINITNNFPNYTCFGYKDIKMETKNIYNTISDEFNDILKPTTMNTSTKLGIMFGSINSHSIPEYHTQTSKYLIILSGEITIKLLTIRNCEKLNNKKFIQKIFTSTNTQFTHFCCDKINLWDSKNVKLQKIPFLEFNAFSGYAISIPSYTVWTITYNKPNTIVFTVDYISFINSIANLGNWLNFQYDYRKINDLNVNDANNEDVDDDNNEDVDDDNNEDVHDDNNEDVDDDNNEDVDDDNKEDIDDDDDNKEDDANKEDVDDDDDDEDIDDD